ncbi:hypothetical protein ACUXI4_000352 [Pantoea piersonii]|jgi:hypothetical protein
MQYGHAFTQFNCYLNLFNYNREMLDYDLPKV